MYVKVSDTGEFEIFIYLFNHMFHNYWTLQFWMDYEYDNFNLPEHAKITSYVGSVNSYLIFKDKTL